jgi:hypothetical protein
MSMRSFADSFHVVGLRNAKFFAEDLFRESFASEFPVPPVASDLSNSTPHADWHQYVAFYKWSEESVEPVGFCNWIRHADVYLGGGMCVRRNFYRRLPRLHLDECKQRGGVAQIMLEAAGQTLNDCAAWFGYCGDKKAYIVDTRFGFQPTDRPYVLVKWFRDVPAERKRELIDQIAAIGPF